MIKNTTIAPAQECKVKVPLGEQSPLLIEVLTGFYVSKPAFKSFVVEGQNSQVAQSPVCVESFLRTTTQAAIAANAVVSQDRIGLQVDIVHGTFGNKPPALVASCRIRFWFRQHAAQKSIRAEQCYEIVEATAWLEGIRTACGYSAAAPGRHVLDDLCCEAAGLGNIPCVRAIRETTFQTRGRMMQLPVAEKPTHHLSPFILQQASQVEKHSIGRVARSCKDKGAPALQGWQGLYKCLNLNIS